MPDFTFTPELIKQQADLKDLPDNQIAAFQTLGNNLLTTAIGEKTKEVRNDLDAILNGSGIERLPNEKTGDYAQRVRDAVKSSTEAQATLKTEIEGYKKAIKDGDTSPAMKKQLEEAIEESKQLKHQKTQLEAKYKTDLEAASKEGETQKGENQRIKEDIEFAKFGQGLEFNDKYTDEDRQTLIDAKIALIRQTHTSKEVVVDGKKTIQWVNNATGLVELNPEKGMSPITGADLLTKLLPSVINTGVKANGTGSNPPKNGADNKVPFALTAKTKMEAEAQIREWQISQGRNMQATETHDEASKIFTDSKANLLPLR